MERRFMLYRASVEPPPFVSVCSWSDSYEVARARRVQRVAATGFGAIWRAEISIDHAVFLDARDDADLLATCLDLSNRRLRDAAHEDAALLSAQGWQWVAFTETDQPGPEFIYLHGEAIDAQYAND